MVNPKVKACFQSNPANPVTFYTAVDLSGYENDVKDFVRKLEIYRTDTNTLIAAKTLAKDEFKVSTLVGSFGVYENNLTIRAVLYHDGVKVSEHSASFNGLQNFFPNDNGIQISKTSGSYKAVDNYQYPFYSGKSINDFERYFINMRRETKSPASHKIQFINNVPDNTVEIGYPWFNEVVVLIYSIWIDKETGLYFEAISAANTLTNDLLSPLYNAGGIYQGTPNYDPLGNEDALPNYSFLDNQTVTQPSSPFGNLLRPHILKWDILTDGGQTDEGYPLPGTTTTVQVPCRFVPGGTRVFKNADSTEQGQKGRIRVDVGSPIPKQGQLIEVVGFFKGIAQEVYNGGHLTGWRIDV